MKLVPIPNYDTYRLNVMFDCYKWDPQFGDNNTVASYALILTEKESKNLKEITEKIDKETITAEQFLNEHLELSKTLLLPKKISREFKNMKNYDPNKHIRLMRYDFHPTIDGKFAVSEVNSDVPGGFAEGSIMPQEALNMLKNDKYSYINFSDNLINSIKKKVVQNGKLMLVHCTSYSDDRQVMQFLGDKLEKLGFTSIYGAIDHINFKNNEAFSILDGNEGKIDAILRFTPVEWFPYIKPKTWKGFFSTVTPSCNHPISSFAQTKRFPLIWSLLEKYGLDFTTWKEFLPETKEVKDVKNDERYIFKPACGRVGEKISIKEACVDDEYKKIIKDVKRHPKQYIAQKKFNSMPLEGLNGEKYHLCLGSYTVDGKAAGFYARISKTPRIDSSAADIPVLIERSSNEE